MKGKPGEQNGADEMRVDIDSWILAVVTRIVIYCLPVSLCQANTLLKDKSQDPLVGLACQQLMCARSLHHSPVSAE